MKFPQILLVVFISLLASCSVERPEKANSSPPEESAVEENSRNKSYGHIAKTVPPKMAASKNGEEAMMAKPPAFGEIISSPSFSAGISDTPSPKPTVDSILDQLGTSNMAFNAPRSINLGDHAEIHFIVDPTKSVEDIKSSIEAEGAKHGFSILVSKILIAKLVAPEFDITNISPERQALDTNGPTEWRWSISPNTKGSHKVHLTVVAVIKVEGESTERFIKSFDQEIVVKVTLKTWIEDKVSKYWQWLWSAILIPLAGIAWKKFKK